MKIKHIEIKNFRLLRSVAVGLEEHTTLIVGRNNSGKTSIAELFRRLLSDKTPTFRLEDFSLGCHENFWTAFEAFRADASAADVCGHLPSITVTLDIAYDVDAPDLGPLSDCIIDLNPDCSDARLVLSFGPRPTAAEALYAGIAAPGEDAAADRITLFRALGSRLPAAYASTLEAVDPNDPTNRKALDLKMLIELIHGGFINAQRGLDDDTHRSARRGQAHDRRATHGGSGTNPGRSSCRLQL